MTGGPVAVAATDIGASGGRVIVGRAGPGVLDLHEAHRFPNTPVSLLGTLHWDILALYDGMLAGLRAAGRDFDLASVGIDTWGVDFGLLDAAGALLGNPVHYRDARTTGVVEKMQAVVPAAEFYATTGTQQLPFNTSIQLTAMQGSAQLAAARTLLLIPDLLGYWLTGQPGAELTNASTTQLLDIRTLSWAAELLDRTGLPAASSRRCAGPATRSGRCCPRSRPRSG